MKSIFEFLDYRDFLQSFYEHHKAHTKGFSYRSFLQEAGISSPSFFKQVIDRKRKLTTSATQKFLLALNLNKIESEYFTLLVEYTHAILNSDKQAFYRQMREIARSQDLKLIGEECYDYYEFWYTSALRELLCQQDFQDNWKAIGDQLCPKVPAKDVQNATETLLRLGFLHKTQDGIYEQTNATITTGLEVDSMSIRNFNTQCIDLAGEAIRKLPKEQRHATGVTMGCSSRAYELITAEIEKLQGKILDILKDDKDQDRVLQFNTMLFPMSQIANQLGNSQAKEDSLINHEENNEPC